LTVLKLQYTSRPAWRPLVDTTGLSVAEEQGLATPVIVTEGTSERGARHEAPVLASLGLRAAAVADLFASLARLLSPVLDVLIRLWLAAGFLVSEAIVHNRNQIAKLSTDGDNRVVVDLADGVKLKLNSAQRFGTISSSCGLCGKTSIDAIRQSFPAIESTNVRIDIETLLSLPEKLRNAQGDFARTGGIHAAGIFDVSGELKIVREDIGRHNAVDKVIGRAFLDRLLPLNRRVLLVSGRASFEIVQKALAAGIPIVAAVSAPSTLAVDFARESNQTLIGFLRPPSFNIYSHIERVILEAL